MSHEYLCPCCEEGYLEEHLPEGPDKPYTVECSYCGTRFDHDLLMDGANGLVEFMKLAEANHQDPVAENWADNSDEYWECSCCHVKRKKVPGDPPFVHCPDCGELVYSYS